MGRRKEKREILSREQVYPILLAVYEKFRRRYRGNPDSKQMCCMWSTDDPPDSILDTEQWEEIERRLDMSFDGDVAWSLYDMDVAEAAEAIAEAGKPL